MSTISIPLHSRKFPGLSSLIDENDYDLVVTRRWYPDQSRETNFYARSGKQGISMHRLILGVEETHVVVDHINRDGLDNRRSNLRVATHAENNFNVGIRNNNSLGLIGVGLRESGRWSARIINNYRHIRLGMFDSAIDAAIAYDKAAIELRGESAVTNQSLGLIDLWRLKNEQ